MIARTSFAFIVAAALAASAAAASTVQKDSGCAPVFAALRKVVRTPHHVVGREPGRSAEMTYTADAIYVMVRDRWIKSPITLQDMIDQQEAHIRDAKVYTCHALPDDTVDGERAAVYKTHTENDDIGTRDAQIWISRSAGLILRTEADVPSAGGRRHESDRFDYTNIHAPVVGR